ncbi:MAG: hypothetical protein FWG77_00515 [Treponema sp.]|nr:hypothetical protein [Treponema sp.]
MSDHRSKKFLLFICMMIFLGFAMGPNLEAQMSFNGATGLYSIPSANIGWERSNGVDIGYHAIFSGGDSTHIPKIAVSLFNWIELGAAFDIQPAYHYTPDRGTDMIINAKLRIPLANTSLAIGGNFQRLNFINNDGFAYNAGQVYMAYNYSGLFFNSPARTTVVVGKSFNDNTTTDSSVDFGMGFSVAVLPRQFGGLVHWITDFANFSYSAEPFGANATHRGVINSGFRFDFSIVPAFSRIKLVVDLVLTDALDSNRAFSAGATFGVPFQ